MTTASRRGWWLLALLAPICWWVGQGARHTLIHTTDDISTFYLLLFGPGAVAGVLLGAIARTLGLPAIRTLLSSVQAVLFGTLATSLLVITLTGTAWTSYKGDESGQLIWIILLGATILTFIGIWSLLAIRAAAAAKALTNGLLLCASAIAMHALGFLGLIIFSQWLERHQPELSVPLFLLNYLLYAIFLYLPVALIACGTAGIVGGLGRGTPAPVSPPTSPDEPPAPYVPPTPVPTSPPAQPSPAESYHGEEPSLPPPIPASVPAPAIPAAGSAPQPGADDTAEEVPAPSETDRG